MVFGGESARDVPPDAAERSKTVLSQSAQEPRNSRPEAFHIGSDEEWAMPTSEPAISCRPCVPRVQLESVHRERGASDISTGPAMFNIGSADTSADFSARSLASSTTLAPEDSCPIPPMRRHRLSSGLRLRGFSSTSTLGESDGSASRDTLTPPELSARSDVCEMSGKSRGSLATLAHYRRVEAKVQTMQRVLVKIREVREQQAKYVQLLSAVQ